VSEKKEGEVRDTNTLHFFVKRKKGVRVKKEEAPHAKQPAHSREKLRGQDQAPGEVPTHPGADLITRKAAGSSPL